MDMVDDKALDRPRGITQFNRDTNDIQPDNV